MNEGGLLGLGQEVTWSARHFGIRQTEQYLGPTIAFNGPHGLTYKFSPEFGLNDNSVGVLWRFGVSYEISQFRDWFRRTK